MGTFLRTMNNDANIWKLIIMGRGKLIVNVLTCCAFFVPGRAPFYTALSMGEMRILLIMEGVKNEKKTVHFLDVFKNIIFILSTSSLIFRNYIIIKFKNG